MLSFNQKIVNATKWSSIAEIIAKMINPLVSMLLARILTPEAFGVVATLSMIITFAEIFTDAGFQKYLIQHEFKDLNSLYKSTTIAFWSNLVLSFIIWLLISIYSDSLAILVGSPDLGNAIIIACVAIPIQGFSSIQTALFKRNFNFRTLFFLRIISISVPLLVTIPLAFVFKNFWALLIGTLFSYIINAIFITIKSDWRPSFYFDFKLLKEMLSFSMWTVIESISIWLTLYIDIFLVGTFLNEHFLGLYKTSTTIVSQMLGIVSGILVPVLFSSLSRVQNNLDEFRHIYYTFQKAAGLLLLPLGVGIYIFRDTITFILLGEQWMEISWFIGVWSLSTVFVNLFSNFSSEAYRALGKPKYSTMSQFLHIIVLWPVIIWAVRVDFLTLCWSRALVRVEGILVNAIMLQVLAGISIFKTIKLLKHCFLSTFIMAVLGWYLHNLTSSIGWNVLFIMVCGLIYIFILSLNRNERQLLLGIIKSIKNRT